MTVLNDCLEYLSIHRERYRVIALVGSKDCIPRTGVSLILFKNARSSYFHKLFYEYFYFKKISKRLNPSLWLSLNDCTPSVVSDIRAVYCHNATPFYHRTWKDLVYLNRTFFQSFYYNLFYRWNIEKNNFIIVQSVWFKRAFSMKYGIDSKKIIVNPFGFSLRNPKSTTEREETDKRPFVFFFPSLARNNKNFELIGETAMILQDQGISGFQVLLTISGNENSYARRMKRKYGNVSGVSFIGLLSKESVFETYSRADCLIFPSTLETFGLPIVEFKAFNKPLLLIDAPYARETLGDYDKVSFFNGNAPEELAIKMRELMTGHIRFQPNRREPVSPPFAADWDGLFQLLFSE